jgi:hypothetical protein
MTNQGKKEKKTATKTKTKTKRSSGCYAPGSGG